MIDIPKILRPHMEPDADGKGVLLVQAPEGDPCICMLSIPAVQFDDVQKRFTEALKRAPVCRRDKPANASIRVLCLCRDIPAYITNRRIAHEGITAFFGGNGTLIRGEWNIPQEVTEIPDVPFADIEGVVVYAPEKPEEEEKKPAVTSGNEKEEQNPQTTLKIPEPEETTANTPDSQPPEPEPFDGMAIPQEMKNRNQWLCWKYDKKVNKKGEIEFSKVPRSPEIDRKTSAPIANWSYETCRKAMAAGYRGFVGIGFSLRDGIAGVDFDHVLDVNGQLKPEYAYLQEVIDTADSYTEISPSGNGLHIYFQCDDIPPECKAGDKKKGDFEMYCEGRYFTVTGKAWRKAGVLRTISADEYRKIHSILFGGTTRPLLSMPTEASLNTAAGPAPESEPAKRTKPSRSNDEVFYRVTRTPKGKALWEGDSTDYPSPSEADYALICRIAEATGCNREQTIQVFMESTLAKREKSIERPDYVEITVDNAIRAVLQSQQRREVITTQAGREEKKYGLFGGGGNNWQAEAAYQICKDNAGKLRDIRRAGEGIYAVIDPYDGIVKLASSGRDDVFQRWCNTHFADVGYDPKFAEEMFRNISVLHTADPIPEIDISKPITAVPCLNGYISLKDGKRCKRPAEIEYCPFVLHLTAEEAEYDPNYQLTGRVFPDLLTYVGKPTVLYLLSVTAASIPRIPANRRVVIFTGPSRSSKTTFGMILSELGLAPPRNVDFSTEIDGRGRYRPELANHMSQYPMLFVNDPHEPDATAVKKLCDETQQYERKYVNQCSVFQRATCVLTMNHPPKFRTSAMEEKVFFVNSRQSFRGKEIPLNEYMESIRNDGSLRDIWQAILRSGIMQGWKITIPEECKEHNKRMQIGAAPLQKWLSMCRPPQHNRKEDFHDTQEVFENYICYVNPFENPVYIHVILEKKAKSASWKPNPTKDGLVGESKSEIIRQLEAIGIAPTRYKQRRGFFVHLPTRPDFFDEMGTVDEEEIETITTEEAWRELFSGREQQKRID